MERGLRMHIYGDDVIVRIEVDVLNRHAAPITPRKSYVYAATMVELIKSADVIGREGKEHEMNGEEFFRLMWRAVRETEDSWMAWCLPGNANGQGRVS